MFPRFVVKIGEIHVHMGDPGVAEAVSNLEETFMALSAKLQAAIDDINARLEQTNTELDAIATALDNQDQVTAAAVAAALARAGVDEDAAADIIASAAQSVREHVDAVFAKVGVTPPPTTGDTGGGDTTQEAGAGNDTIDAGAGNDVIDTGGGDSTTQTEAFAITTTSLPDAVVGQPYTGIIEFVNGAAPFGILNAPVTENGLTLNPDGSVTGTPESEGDVTFDLSAQDSTTPSPQTATGSATVHTNAAQQGDQE